jgi:hypothetical protein
MVIFRARRKIHRAMRRIFEGLPPDMRPARDPSTRRQAYGNDDEQKRTMEEADQRAWAEAEEVQ